MKKEFKENWKKMSGPFMIGISVTIALVSIFIYCLFVLILSVCVRIQFVFLSAL